MNDALRFHVAASHSGQRLDVILAALLDESRSQAAARLERGEVVRGGDGVRLTKSYRPNVDEEIVVRPPPPEPSGAAGVTPPPILYEDEDLLVVDKPAGMVVHPGTGNPAGTMIQTLAAAGVALSPAAGEERPGVVHRLDRDTSGLLVVAKSDVAYRGLVAALKARDVERRYLALVEGGFDADDVRIEAPVGRDPGDRKRFAAVSDGKPAVTHLRQLGCGVVEGWRVALLTCRLETGRTHQIRVHLSYADHPVVGDLTYGAAPALLEHLGLERLFLHAARLRFLHPVTGTEVAVDSPLPADLSRALDAAGIVLP